jgi:hypothetical protein
MRPALIVLGIILFAGLVLVSLLGVRYPGGGAERGEPYITERSLTHSVVRDPNGTLAEPSGSGGGETEGGGKKPAEPCPT